MFLGKYIIHRKQILGPYRNSSLRIIDLDFLALGHVGNSRVSSIVNLQCHLINTRYCIIYCIYIICLISAVVTFILTVKNTNHAGLYSINETEV